MNRRIKIEGIVKSNKIKSAKSPTRVKHVRSSAITKKTPATTKKVSKKRSSSINNAFSIDEFLPSLASPGNKGKQTGALKKTQFHSSECSDDEFLPSLASQRNRDIQTDAIKNKQFCSSDCFGSASNNTNQNVNKRRSIQENIYQISDSSDDELNLINKDIGVDNIDLCDTENDTSTSIIEILSDKIQAQTDKQKFDCRPSTSKGYVSPKRVDYDSSRKVEGDDFTKKAQEERSSVKDDMTEFIDNLLDTNKDFMKDSGLKSLQELNQETEKLLATSWDLICEDTPSTNLENSVIYVCTDNYPKKSHTKEEKPPEAIQTVSATVDLTKQRSEEQIKPSCPICLEEFGQEPMAATICGHIFCASCINNCVKTQRKCPTCRKRLTTKMVHPLFLF